MIGTPEVIDPAINPEKMEMWGTEIPGDVFDKTCCSILIPSFKTSYKYI